MKRYTALLVSVAMTVLLASAALASGEFITGISPGDAENPVGTAHTVTATVHTSGDVPAPGVVVTFDVWGANNTFGTQVTNTQGDALFTYVGLNEGSDEIRAYLDTNNNGVWDSGESYGSANKFWCPATGCTSGGGTPTSAGQCKESGWELLFALLFRNQGDCVSFVQTHGLNPPSGPAAPALKPPQPRTP